VEKTRYVGIDLGTTNSAACVYDGERTKMVRSAQGGVLTPSVVRIDARQHVLCGGRARKFLEADPDNTRSEFKRLMGTEHRLSFKAANVEKKPEELAALVLSALRKDIEEEVGFEPARAVVAVPALFELPQSRATSEAARLAGFESIELLQEPVASAIAAGWSSEHEDGPWLVYDLGGGTFDASLLETQDGLLRVVGHDGDNFLGGRDIDTKLSELCLAEVERAYGVTIDRKNPAFATPLRRLRLACEEAKLDAAKGGDVIVSLPNFGTVEGRSIDIDVVIARPDFDRVVAAIVDATLDICSRLLARHGLGGAQLGRVVLVGGPTVLPLLRQRVGDVLKGPIAANLDPMTLVAEGAALFAASANLDARPKVETAARAAKGPKVWMQYPAMTSDLAPHVVGKMGSAEHGLSHVFFRRTNGAAWESAPEALDAEGAFAASVALMPHATSEFLVLATTNGGAAVSLDPERIAIRHGITLSDPPLSRSIGVALADGGVRVYFERGSPLPMRRTFTFETTQTLSPGDGGFALRVPIVQGEFPFSHLCRLVGALEIPAAGIERAVSAGTTIEVTLSLDRGGGLKAQARIFGLDAIFDGVAHLVTPNLDPAELVAQIENARKQIAALYIDPTVSELPEARAELGRIDAQLDEWLDWAHLAQGGDADALEKARRALLDVDAKIQEIESKKAWPKLDEECQTAVGWAARWIGEYGTQTERRSLEDAVRALERARLAQHAAGVKRQLALVRGLSQAAYFRYPQAWEDQFEMAASRISEARDLTAATSLVAEGRAAVQKEGDRAAVERVTRGLWKLLPTTHEALARGLGSNVR